MTTMPWWRRRNRGGVRDRRGVAAIEFAIASSALALMMMGIYDYGNTAWHSMQVRNAVRAGSAWAAYHGFDAGKIATTITTASNYPAITATPAPAQICGCPDPVAGIVASACTGSCPGGGAIGKYVTVSARAVYHFVLPLPGRNGAVTMSAQGIARLE
ncbi:MAG: pilus assembly protein [Acetobacteraceae bacterium]|nr:pilus assembly protein [Acetobacteraceae bacterium]